MEHVGAAADANLRQVVTDLTSLPDLTTIRFVARCNAQTLDPQDGVIVNLNGTSLALSTAAWNFRVLGGRRS